MNVRIARFALVKPRKRKRYFKYASVTSDGGPRAVVGSEKAVCSSPLLLSDRPLRPAILVALVVATSIPAALAAAPRAMPTLTPVSCPRIADPKLAAASITVSYLLGPVGQTSNVTVEVKRGIQTLRTVFSGAEMGSSTPQSHVWDGKSTAGQVVDPGGCTIVVTAVSGPDSASVTFDVAIVRLGITEMKTQPASATDTWPMVYFMKGTAYGFYATPAVHSYLSIADTGETSDLDLDTGAPRPAPPLWTDTATPPLEGSAYEDDAYDYPIAYLQGRSPQIRLTFGDSSTSATSGARVGCGYPVAGFHIRCLGSDGSGDWTTSVEDIAPGGTTVLTGPALPAMATRTDRSVTWRWQYRPTTGGVWEDVPGTFDTALRFYTTIGTPVWATGATGTQYSGPWVEAAEYLYTWQTALGIPADSEAKVVEAFMKGFFGQNGPLTTAIEGVVYDCYPAGGDGGASHYYNGSSTFLSRLLNAHALGKYVNCSDVASTTSTMLGMLGVQNVRMLRLGTMQLRPIWGIGTPVYTNDLWGNGNHGFNYHHIVTRNGGTNVSDACMWLDEEGSPAAFACKPGYNCDRPWLGPQGYMALAAWNNVTTTLDPLPFLQ